MTLPGGKTYFVFDIFEADDRAYETVEIRRKHLAYRTRRSRVTHVVNH